MPLAQSLPALRRQLQEILTEDLAAALNALKELLPENSDKHGQVLALQARLKDANKERIRNTLAPDEYLRRVDTIRAECFDLLRDLEEADFEVKEKAASATASAAKQGSVLYRVPHQMPLRKPTICTVRVALDEDAILEDIVLDDDVRLRQRVEVSDMMKAELLDPEGDTFSIRQLSEPEQLVRDTGYTQWLFSVTPRVEGEHQLLVKVSMMEFNANLGKYVPREVSILETVTIVTETALSDSDEAPMKATGERFALSPDTPGELVASPPATVAPPQPVIRVPNPPIPNRQSPASGLRAVAFFLAFLMVGTTATWAFTPPPTRDWWLASLKDDADAYAGYIEKYKDSDAKQHLEKAYFYKADKTNALRDLRDYQRQYPEGQFREQVLEKIKTLEIKSVESIRQEPAAEKIRQFVRDFPESERLSELKQAAAARAELLPVVEEAYVYSIDTQPTRTKVLAYLLDFPQRERLPEVAEAAASRPEVLREVQPDLENAFLQKMEQNTDAPQAEAFLRNFPVPTQREKFERILEKKPALKKQFLQKMEKAAEEQKAREEERQQQKLSKNSTTQSVGVTASHPDTTQDLKSLDLSGRQLNNLPAEIWQMTNLQSLNLSSNRLSSLPTQIGQLTDLQSLNLRWNFLSSLPAQIGQLKNLQSLDLHSNELSNLPAEIWQLTNLQSLDLSINNFSSLSAQIGQLKNLQSLDLGGNKLSSLPAQIGQLKNLQSLNLYGNKLSSLPAEIGQLTNLQSLSLDINDFSSLPAQIGQLKNLTSLNLSQNYQLNGLPAQIWQLTNLQSLRLSYTQLSNLSAQIGQLTNLQSLSLYGNKLSSLPPQIRSLKSLKELSLGENLFSAEYIEQLRKDMPWCKINF